MTMSAMVTMGSEAVWWPALGSWQHGRTCDRNHHWCHARIVVCLAHIVDWRQTSERMQGSAPLNCMASRGTWGRVMLLMGYHEWSQRRHGLWSCSSLTATAGESCSCGRSLTTRCVFLHLNGWISRTSRPYTCRAPRIVRLEPNSVQPNREHRVLH